MARAMRLKYKHLVVFVCLWLFIMVLIAGIFKIEDSINISDVPWLPSYSGSRHKIISQRTQKGSIANNVVPRLDEFVRKFQSRYNGNGSVFNIDVKESYDAFLDRLNRVKPRGAMLLTDRAQPGMNYIDKFIRGISRQSMYDPSEKQLLQDIISNLSNLSIVSAEKAPSIGSLKVNLLFSDGTLGRVKFIRAPRDYETPDKVYQNDELERHTSEIAGYHLDRVLGFNKAVPTVGRQLNMTRDLVQFLSDPDNVTLVYTSPIGNRCFAAQCYPHCEPEYPFCGRGDMIEASVSLTLPVNVIGHIVSLKNPFARSPYYAQSTWLYDDNYCNNTARSHSSMIGSRTFLDLIDISMLDYFTGRVVWSFQPGGDNIEDPSLCRIFAEHKLAAPTDYLEEIASYLYNHINAECNMDRHDIEPFISLGNESFILHIDNGKGFGRWRKDDDTALVILAQCCQIRLSTLATFIKLYAGPENLSDVMRRSLSSDPLSPILLEPHLDALDRRLAKVIKAMADCIHSGRPWNDVVIDDISM